MILASKSPLEIKELSKNYGSLQAVKKVNIELQPGEIFGLLGPNGAGKTSIISILTTLESPTTGTALVYGEDVTQLHSKAKTLIGLVPQEIVSHGFFTVKEVLEFHSGYYGIKKNDTHISFLLKELGLEEHQDKRVRQLSGGMKRRLLIAKALVHKPKLLLLDEPTAGVDVDLRNTLWKFVRKLNQEGMAILLTTHYLEEAESLCHRVGVIHKGEILKIDETKELVKKLTHRELTIYLNSPIEEKNIPYVIGQTHEKISFRVPHDFELCEVLTKIPSTKIKDMKFKEGKLEDAFLNLLGGKNA